MKLNKNDLRGLEALIAESEEHTEHLQRLLARLLHGNKSKQLGTKAQTPKKVMAWWNEWADRLGCPKIDTMNPARKAALRRRLKAGQWDIKKIELRLRTLGTFALTGDWFGLDYFLSTETKWSKFIEGRWSVDPARKAVARARDAERTEMEEGFGEPCAEDSVI